MSRWTYKKATVTEGDNTLEVRQLTQKERGEFAEASRKIKAGEMKAQDLPPLILKFAALGGLSAEEIDEMPPELADAGVRKIMELSGMNSSKDAPDDDDGEKKDS